MTAKKQLVAPGVKLKKLWEFFNKFPTGHYLFSLIVGRFIPYTGSIKPLVLAMEDGHAAVKLHDRHKIRNHLQSIHAIALANLGEFTTGLTLIPQLGERANAILTKIEIVYFKKARGTLISNATAKLPPLEVGDSQHPITAIITNEAGEIVCEVHAIWQVRVKAS